jgi:hypothetical protein
MGMLGVTGSLVGVDFTDGRNRGGSAIGPSGSFNVGLTYVGDTFHGGLTAAS